MLLLVILALVGWQAPPPQPIVVTTLVADLNGDGQLDQLQIVMTSGRRYVDREPWCGMSYFDAPKYEGAFVARVSLRSRQIVDTDLNQLLGSSVWFFKTDWRIHTFHLPHSRALAFTLGQYGFCKSWGYRVFRVKDDGQVLAVTPELYNGDGTNSTAHIYPTADGFQITEVFGDGGPPTACARWAWDSSAGVFVRRGERAGACEEQGVAPDGET